MMQSRGDSFYAGEGTDMCRHCNTAFLAIVLALSATAASADSLSGSGLVAALRDGGYIIVMRHPSSPFTAPDKGTANPDNTGLERQLDETGRKTARAMGEAMRKLRIPIAEVLSSPTYRALEAVKLADLGKPRTVAELGEGAKGMMANADAARSAWLRTKVADAPRAGTDTIIVTHTPNLTGAFAGDAAGMAAGEALIFHPDGKGGSALVARIKIEDWPKLSAN
jgi:phosphohistidine phosphatase SixA